MVAYIMLLYCHLTLGSWDMGKCRRAWIMDAEELWLVMSWVTCAVGEDVRYGYMFRRPGVRENELGEKVGYRGVPIDGGVGR